jgi:hypothetical protein
MKAKIYIGIITAVLLPGFLAQAQISDSRDYRDGYTTTEVNNYYNYDYYYSSRINRFHRSFSTFNYYAPLFTDSYWYNYEPYSWGLTIYGGGGIGFGYSYNYPVYFDYGWNNPYFGGSYYRGYNPFYFSTWFSPVVINIGFGNRWHNNYYSWRGHNRWDYDYRHDYNTYNNNYYSRGYQSNNNSSNSNFSRRNESVNNNTQVNNVSRRENSNYTQTDINRNDRTRTNSGVYNGVYNNETRRAANISNSQNIINEGDRRNENNVTRSNNNQNRNANQSVSYPSNTEITRRAPQLPERSQSTVTARPVQSDRTEKVNTNVNRPVVRSESASAPARRPAVSSGNNSGSGKSVSAPSRSSSSSVKSSSSSQRNSSTTRSESRTSGGSSSKESGRRR